MMASRSVGEVLNGQMEVLSVGQSVDKRSGQTMLKTRVRFTSGPFKGIETLVKQPANSTKSGGSKSTAKSTSKAASKSTGKAAKSTSKAAKSTASKAPAKGKATKVKPAETEPDDDPEALNLDFEDDEE